MNIGFVALDVLNREIEVKCYEKTYGLFQTMTLKAGGNSGDCLVNNTVIPENKTYEFYITASAGSETVTSSSVFVKIDRKGPSPVTNYSKTSTEACKYDVSFTTADDGGESKKVQIFRSTNRTFTASSSNLVKEMSVTSLQSITYTDTLPVCDVEYFYAIRVFDDANNASSMVTDPLVIVVQPEKEEKEEVEELVVDIEEETGSTDNSGEVQGETTVEEEDNEEDTVDETDTNGEVEGEEDINDENIDDDSNEENKEKDTFWDWFKYVLIGLVLITLSGSILKYVANRRNEK